MTLSIVIPTLDAGATLAQTLVSLGDVREVLVVDGGSHDDTVLIAERARVRVLHAQKGRGCQLAEGAANARGDWLLFLHADTCLERDWQAAVTSFIEDPTNTARAAVFRFQLDHGSAEARRLEAMVDWRVRRLGLPYGDQGLLIHRDFYHSIGGFRPIPIMEDVDLVLRIGRSRLEILPIAARTSAKRWMEQGWTLRSAQNIFCLVLYFVGVPARLISRVYH
ncbi:TIGR04283 family arsenosugar biosynthesis glycosyltransferase [Hyphomicrobium sp.]|uniref:TIGR04283 family arsenosugar biosynthesis glycosyltransferase n=1 Tax=Hyphomicrobium sp. TaxID=82 RepID=UPI001D841AE9|nr:TIGR04283 family arsenosugar biosynthesis glycosyltransferase [Hyphomicrobium sp.]MBY0560455.1 TIGR04283 family arsenosugar biosynthesis glycosyltransferase [Hyphomicrobium sp.]